MSIIKSTRGFTLIELLVTISIIVLLSAISLVALQGSRQSGRDARRKSDLESIRSALELYKSDCGAYPPTANVVFGNNLISTTPPCSVSGNTYIRLPQDPQSTSRHYYYNRLTNTTYELCAALEGATTSASCGGNCGVVCNYRVLNP